MPTEQQIRERKWCWTGHTLCNPKGATERYALDWKPQGTEKRGSKENGEKNKIMGTAEGWRKLERSKRTSLGQNQMEELQEGSMFRAETKGVNDDEAMQTV